MFIIFISETHTGRDQIEFKFATPQVIQGPLPLPVNPRWASNYYFAHGLALPEQNVAAYYYAA